LWIDLSFTQIWHCVCWQILICGEIYTKLKYTNLIFPLHAYRLCRIDRFFFHETIVWSFILIVDFINFYSFNIHADKTMQNACFNKIEAKEYFILCVVSMTNWFNGNLLLEYDLLLLFIGVLHVCCLTWPIFDTLKISNPRCVYICMCCLNFLYSALCHGSMRSSY
jgi:hypothetical protein